MKILSVILTLFLFSIYQVTSYTANADNKEMIQNISTLGYEVKDGKSWVDSKTGYTISTCSDDYNIIKQLGIKTDKNEPACSKTKNHEGACWVTNLGFTGGSYKAEICYQPASGYVQCKTLSAGEKYDKFDLKTRTLSYTDPYYSGSFSTKDDQDCPDYTHNINALGYVYIKEATDKQYINATDFATRFCQPLSEKYNPSRCSSPQICPCDDEECRANNFIPPKTSTTWKKATQKAKSCYLCLQNYRAVNYYCNKIYQCLNKSKKSYAYDLAVSDNRKYLDELYGEGFYLCGYYDGKLCGCGKSKLSAGPRHFLRVAKQFSGGSCSTRDELITNPQCNLFNSGVYARQFYNKYEDHKDADCPYEINSEFGYKKRGTFFSPKITVVFGNSERLIGYNSSLLIDNDEYYYNSPIGESYEYSVNNFYNLPTAKKILFSNFYPVIFTIGATNQTKDENGNCVKKTSGEIAYIMLRLEYNFSTNESALVAYKVRFVNYIPSDIQNDKSLFSDGSISKFIVKDNDFIQAIKNAKNILIDKTTMGKLEFKYNYDDNPDVPKTTIPENGQYLYFENIGKVSRPPLKYSYDEGSIYLNSPIVLEQDLSSDSNSKDTGEARLKISIVPSKLSSFDGDEFLNDKELSTFTKKISIAGSSPDAFVMSDDVIINKSESGITSEVIMYMKKFSIKYNNSCVFLKTMNNPGQEEYLLNPPKDISECSGLFPLEKKMSCLLSFISLYECNGYVNCLDKEKSIIDCQNEDRRPKIKLFGTDNDLPEYKKNIDFRSYTQICVDEGFEFADKLSEYSNTKLFGDFGYAPYDYTIRWKKNSGGISSSTPGRPLSLRYNDIINESEDYQDKPKDIITMDIDYFSSSETDRQTNIINRLRGVNMIDNSSGMPSEKTAYDQYAPECKYNQNTCINRYEVKHRLVNETLGTLCVSAGNFNNGNWNLKSRDLGVDYNIYVPLRCQYVYFDGSASGGAGFTTEENTNCMVQYHVIESAWWFLPPLFWIPTPGFMSGAYLRTPKFDATGSVGGSVTTKINLNLLPVFDGYLYVTIGPKTLFSRAQINDKNSEDPEKCFIGSSPHYPVYRNSGDWMVRGGTHGFWYLDYNSLIKRSGDNIYISDPKTSTTKDVNKYYDYRKGNTEIAFDTHGGDISSFDEKGYILEQYQNAKKNLEDSLDEVEFTTLIENDNKYRLSEFYFVSLMHLSYRLKYIDDALFGAQNIAFEEVKKKYKDNLIHQQELKSEKENEKNNLQQQLDVLSPDIEECKNIDPDTGRTISGKTREECDDINNRVEELIAQINILISELENIQNEIDRLNNIIDNNLYPENEIKDFDVNQSQSAVEINTLIDNINNEIDEEKKSWMDEKNAHEQHSVIAEQSEILDIKNNYGNSSIQKLQDIIEAYTNSINFVLNVKKSYLDSINNISLSKLDIDSIKSAKNDLEAQFTILINKLMLLSEFNDGKKSIQQLFNFCKNHTDDLINVATVKPSKYVDLITFQHSNNYGLLKSLMCLSFDLNGTDCDEENAIKSHNKIQNFVNLCELTKILSVYNDAKEKIYINNSKRTEKICYRDEEYAKDDDSECTEEDEDENCICKDVEYTSTTRITDEKINLNSKSISDRFETIQRQYNIIIDLEQQLKDISSRVEEKSETSYQYLATALRGSSPIDARIYRKRQGQGNVPYWDGESRIFGDATSFQANLFGKIIDGRLCYSTGLFDVAYKHDYICLHQKGWIEGKRNIVLNDGYGYANSNYTFDTVSNKQSIDRSSTISTELDHRAALGGYEKYEGMSGNGPLSNHDHNAVKGKWNEYEEKQNAGGSFHHLQGSGGGGGGAATVSVSLIGIKQFECNGEKYPDLNIDGTKKITNEDTPDKRCVIKCPPMNVLIKGFEFYFPEIKKTTPIDMVCEYSGEPEHDMEATVNTNVIPKKCYIITDNVAGVGDVKGKIIISSDGICPIAKCAYKTWGFDVHPGANKNISQYDRNTGVCMPRDEYGSEKKTSKYFMMMFDKNVYSGLAYKGTRTGTLTSTLPQYINGEWKMNTYNIASCSETKIGNYIIDTYDQLSVLGKKCSDGGFWSEKNTAKINDLYKERKYSAQCVTEDAELESCEVSNSGDARRNADYVENNAYLNIKEYLIKDFNYFLGKKSGNEFGKLKSNEDNISVSGIYELSNNGRTVFKDKIKCPMLDPDKYDFDNDYTGNAVWDFTDENKTAIALRCSKNSVKIGDSLPTRACKVNGLWGPVMTNSCFLVCEKEIDNNGTKWEITAEDIKKIPEGDTYVTVSGACSKNYLNSQDYNSEHDARKRTCNLLTKKWGNVQGSSVCNDGLICIYDNYNGKIVSTPYARTMVFTKSNQYDELLNGLNDGKYKLSDYTEYKDALYLVFKEGKRYSPIFGSDYYQTDNDYVDVKIEEKNFDLDGDIFITDKKGYRLIDKLPNNDYYVISVFANLDLEVFKYILSNDDTRNEFLNIENWMSTIKDDSMNFTGMWKWKANLSKVKSIAVKDSTLKTAHTMYKNARLLVFIPKLIDNDKNLKHIALFSPYLARLMGADTDIVTDDEKDIKFRYMLDIDKDDLIGNKQYAMVVYDGISSSSRLYRFEWEKGDNEGIEEKAQSTHTIGTRNCNGKYFGYIEHNTTKHIMYTPEPTNSNQVFASLFCYDGRIFGFHAFRSNIYQNEDLTDDLTKDILLEKNENNYNGARDAYEIMKEHFDTLDLKNDYFSDSFDLYKEGPKNAYLYSMMAKYWQAHILPTSEEQEKFIKYYKTKIGNEYVTEIIKRYAEGNKGYYYRILPRRADWISGISAIETINDIYDIKYIDENDPYCRNTSCLQKKQISDQLNIKTNENTWNKCNKNYRIL